MRVLRRRPADGSDAGMSLVELVVTMMIMSIVIAGTVTLTIGFQRTTAENLSRQEQIDTVRFAVETMSGTVRTAVKPAQLTCAGCLDDAFLVGKDSSVRFYANINNPGNTVGPSRVTYALSTTGATAGQLIETVQLPDPVPGGGPGYAFCDPTLASATAACKLRLTSRPIAFGVQESPTAPIFKYYDQAGAPLVPPTGASLSAADLGRVLSIELTVTAQAQNATKAGTTTYIQRIMLPNAQAVIKLNEEATP